MASPLSRKMENIEGDTKYLSLEILQGNSSNLPAGDIFALGATVYELVYSLKQSSVMTNIKNDVGRR